MSIKEQLRSELASLATGSLPGARTLKLAEAGQTLTCEILDLQPLACEFSRFSLATNRLADAAMDKLQAISESLAKQLTYLLEPIGPVEHDHEQCIVQMRSNPPQKDEDGTSYYELHVRRGGELSLCRYQKQPASVRQTIPAVLTREVLVRLAGDFEAAVS